MVPLAPAKSEKNVTDPIAERGEQLAGYVGPLQGEVRPNADEPAVGDPPPLHNSRLGRREVEKPIRWQ